MYNTDALSTTNIGGAFLQSRLFQSLYIKFVMTAESGIYSLRKPHSGNCKSSHESLASGMRRTTPTWTVVLCGTWRTPLTPLSGG